MFHMWLLGGIIKCLPLMVSAGYNFRLILRWLRIFLAFFLGRLSQLFWIGEIQNPILDF